MAIGIAFIFFQIKFGGKLWRLQQAISARSETVFNFLLSYLSSFVSLFHILYLLLFTISLFPIILPLFLFYFNSLTFISPFFIRCLSLSFPIYFHLFFLINIYCHLSSFSFYIHFICIRFSSISFITCFFH